MRLLLGTLGVVTVASVVWLFLNAQRGEWGASAEPAFEPAQTAPALPDPQDTPGIEARAETPPPEPFREQLRAYLAEARTLEPSERSRRAAALETIVLEREAAGELLPAESAYLQLSLLRVSIDDEQIRRQRSEALLARYREASEDGWRAYRERSDPVHDAYRAAEAELVRRAREEGLSDAALRSELKTLREQFYAGPKG